MWDFSWEMVYKIVASAIIVYAAVIIYTRIFGLRTFAKMSAFDFASTVAVGSVIATTIVNTDTSVWAGCISLLVIIALQFVAAFMKQKSDTLEESIENDPILLMDGPDILYDNLDKTEVSKSDLIAKLREANVVQLSQVKAVVLETTGDISVLHGSNQNELDDILLEDVDRE